MVLCLLALPIFAILGIFSLKYRKLTKDSLECLFKTITLKKCSSGLDDKIRSDVTGTFLKYSPKTARFFYKHYKIISWIILIIFIYLLKNYLTLIPECPMKILQLSFFALSYRVFLYIQNL